MYENARTLEAVKFPRYERRGLFMGLKWYQLLWLAAGVLVASVASAVNGPAGLFTSGPLWLVLILLGLLQYSRIPYPVWASHALLFFYRSIKSQTGFLGRPERAVLAGRLALPGGLGNLELRRTAHGEAFIVDVRGREAVAVLRCSTRSFALLDTDDKAWAVQAWSRVQAGMAQRTSVARIAVQDYTVPYPSSALRAFYERAVGAGRPDELTWGQRAYEDLISAAGSAMSHDLLIALVLDTAKARRRIRESGGGVAGVEQVLRLEVEAITTALATHNVRVEEWLPENGILDVIRAAFDPAAVADSAEHRAVDGTENQDSTRRNSASGPMAVEEHWTYVRTDSGFHQTFWIAEWPRQKVFPGFLHPLIYVGDFRHTVTEVIRTVPTAEALRDIRSAQEAHETRRRINTRFDRPLTREQRAEEEEVSQREEEIVAGHGDVRPAAYITITASSLEELARHRQELESAAAGAFVELRLLAGQQWAAFVAGALPFGRGLR
ncbi:SCO6880 family protein [Arthrobacter alkaliphilus]|uniref:SCO6880 family protein n=1 Tax=Arthrobacter alkaliphilus TaxID=369936 RepID=UPI001EF336A5|nr:SCO6880 family protein [Arthrobacter alkaliphilus]